jgi:hypothetical protein
VTEEEPVARKGTEPLDDGACAIVKYAFLERCEIVEEMWSGSAGYFAVKEKLNLTRLH